MIQIEVKNQKQLTFRETADFCASSIRHRFSRSLLTLSVVILAVAFFMYLQCGTLFRNTVKNAVEREIRESRKPAKLLGMLYTPFTVNEFKKMILDAKTDKADAARIASVLNSSPEELSELTEKIAQEMKYTAFFESLSIGRRKELYGRRDGRAVFEYLREEGKLDDMFAKMRKFGGMRIPGGDAGFRVFLTTFPVYEERLNANFAMWRQFQESLKDDSIPQNDPVLIRKFILQASRDPKQLGLWTSKLAEQGFLLSDGELDEIVRYQTMSDRIAKVSTVLQDPEYRKRWRREYGEGKAVSLEDKLTLLSEPATLRMLRDAKYPGGAALTEEDLKEIAAEFRTRKNLRNLEVYLDVNPLESADGFSASQKYLLVLSFLVCVAGITNAMLMSITERFREIATLKCLGATDSFILIQIVLEAMIQGFVGSIAGILLGFLAALIHSSLQVGLRVFSTFDFGAVGMAALYSLASGILLSVLSALYPSFRAARMAPMEAMRVE